MKSWWTLSVRDLEGLLGINQASTPKPRGFFLHFLIFSAKRPRFPHICYLLYIPISYPHFRKDISDLVGFCDCSTTQSPWRRRRVSKRCCHGRITGIYGTPISWDPFRPIHLVRTLSLSHTHFFNFRLPNFTLTSSSKHDFAQIVASRCGGMWFGTSSHYGDVLVNSCSVDLMIVVSSLKFCSFGRGIESLIFTFAVYHFRVIELALTLTCVD